MHINFLTLSKDDLLRVCQNEDVKTAIDEQISEYYSAMNYRLPYKDEDMLVWFLDNHQYHEADQKWHFILL